MTTRRVFLKGIGAGLLMPSTWDLFVNYLERSGEPLMLVPERVSTVLYATRWGEDFQISLGRVDENYPPADMQIRYFIREHCDGKDIGGWPTEDYTQPIGEFFANHIWPSRFSADAQAYNYLLSLDLGEFNDSADAVIGYVDFIEGPCMDNSGHIVCADGLGVSVLQERLIEYGHNTLIRLS